MAYTYDDYSMWQLKTNNHHMKNFTSISSEHQLYFENLIGSTYVLNDASHLQQYGKDYTEDLYYPPQLVLKPIDTKQISKILKYCNTHTIAVTPRGAGTGLSGGSLPIYGGVSLSLERMNRIITIDKDNLQATVEPGVINENLRIAVEAEELFYPPDPASKGSCFLGGNIAHSSGGPKCVKYGTTKDYVLNLEIVLPNGEIIWTGADTLKNSTGYNLTQLMIGSEGTLAIVTKIVLRLIPKPQHDLLLWAAFENAEQACAVVPKIFHQGLVPSALEFMERKAVELSVAKHNMSFDFGMEQAYLLIEVDGNDIPQLHEAIESIYHILESNGCNNILLAEDAATKEKLWKIRRSIGEVVKSHGVYKEEDTVVKRANLPQLYNKVKALEKDYGFESICYGHAGDGNLHVNILQGAMTDAAWKNELPKAITEIFKTCKSLGGTISGEHGIGLVQKQYMPIVMSETHFQLMHGIKNTFDPNGILNPGKIIPENY
jgi:glycolate oxidase